MAAVATPKRKVNFPGARFDPQRKEKMLARMEAENAKLALSAAAASYSKFGDLKLPVPLKPYKQGAQHACCCRFRVSSDGSVL
jgi:hypothetical protein